MTDPQVHPQAFTGWPPRASLGQVLEMELPTTQSLPAESSSPVGTPVTTQIQ